MYTANPSSDNKELAFLIQQYGGTGFLDIVASAIKLPPNSTAYRIIKGTKTISSSFTATAKDIVKNINLENIGCPKYSYMLMIDETYIDKLWD